MTDPKKPEAEATVIIKDRDPIEGKNGGPGKAAEGPGSETVVAAPAKPEPSKSQQEGKARAESAPRGPAEKSAKKEPAGGSPADHTSAPTRKGGGGGLVLLAVILLAVVAGVFLFMRQSDQGSTWTQWLPFNWGSDQRQGPNQDVAATARGGPLRYDWIQTGMPEQVVREILGPPPQTATIGQWIQWEYDIGTALFLVRFQDGKVIDKGLAPYSATSDSQTAQMPPPPSQTAQVQPPPVGAGIEAGAGSPGVFPPQDMGAPQYDRVQPGMSPDTVAGILGAPNEVKRVGQLIEWEYDTGSGYFEVRFQRDKVVYKGMSPYHTLGATQPAPPTASAPPSPPAYPGPQLAPALGPADFDRITMGMSPEAVTQILGKPTLVKKLRNSLEWEYETPQGLFEVRFRNKRVIFKGMGHQPGTPSTTVPPASNGPGPLSPTGGGAN